MVRIAGNSFAVAAADDETLVAALTMTCRFFPMRLIVMPCAEGPEIAEDERQVRPILAGLYVIDTSRAGGRHAAAANCAPVTIPLQRLPTDGKPGGRAVELIWLLVLPHRCLSGRQPNN